jgi:DNA invertase Pin-like site-specific DNA recombinase
MAVKNRWEAWRRSPRRSAAGADAGTGGAGHCNLVFAARSPHAHNHESRRRQYGLVDRAKQLGWSKVEVIDDDLGRSGGGIARPGIERLLATICDGRVGAVLAIEVSRLARNGRDWHTLIEFCGLIGTLTVDEDGIYDPRHPNDRLLLGMKGTMSELELSMFRQRLQ